MKNKIAIVSGAAQGIGESLVRALSAQGAIVAALDVRADALAVLANELPNVHAYALDIRDSAAVVAAVERVETELGAIDALVNVAGVLRLGAVCDLSLEDWEFTFAVNTHGVFYLSQAVAQRMKARRAGSIVTVGSNAAEVPRMQMAAYAASKAASSHFTKCLGLELAEYGIRCNIVSPGSTDTAMQRLLWNDESDAQRVIDGALPTYRTGIPLRRLATPEDITAPVMFLLSDAARHITMHNLCVDGGATLGV
ncbi:2,3-dihydro-2,3-dihydroxybenzoate dehydrogenase [Chitinibacter sp. SCUT-21]|uniref:2,3-dihydro-2,3-dihydroxybenzoate dehydrogenase n=1 Tax=Chitinibacter sp. SCUT-21 TaxID=2970891 RepID=UPI0035A68979